MEDKLQTREAMLANLPQNNNPPVEVIQGEARALLEAWLKVPMVQAIAGPVATPPIIDAIRAMLAFQSEARAGEEGNHPLLIEKLRRQARFNTQDCNCGTCVQCYTTSLMMQAADVLVPSHPIPDREAIALALVNESRRFSGFSLYASLSELEPHRYRDQLRYADAILSLTPSPGGEGS